MVAKHVRYGFLAVKRAYRTRLPPFIALTMATAACSALLGDFPEGRLTSPTADVGATDAGADADTTPWNGPPGSICMARHADIIDFDADDSSVYWLQKAPDPPATFLLIRCENGQNTTVATLPAEPEALALSDQFVFWTVNQGTDAGLGGGVWRIPKGGGQLTGAWRNYNNAGSLAFVKGTIFVTTHDGNIYAEAPDDSSAPRTVATGRGLPSSITASATDAYWIDRSAGIYKATSSGGGTVIGLISAGSGTVLSFLTMGSRGFFWATSGASRSVQFQCHDPLGCHPTLLASPSADVRGLAAYGEEIYWTTNEATNGIVRACTNSSCPKDLPPRFQEPGLEVSRIRAHASYIYFQAKRGDDTYIVQQAK